MINCDFLGKHDICTHPALSRRKGRKCAYADRIDTEEWRCFFRLPRKKGEDSETKRKTN